MQTRILGWLIIIVGLLYTCVWFQDGTAMFIDLPNHTARAYAIGHLHSEPGFQERFLFSFKFTSYIFGDLLFAALLLAVPYSAGSKIFLTLCYFSLPAGLNYFLTVVKAPANTRLLAVLLALFLAANWFLLSAYLYYCLGLGMSFVVLAWSEQLMNGGRSGRWSLFLGGVILVYLTHLASFILTGAIIAALTFSRFFSGRLLNAVPGQTSYSGLRRWLAAAALILPFALLFVHHEYEQLFWLSPRGMAAAEPWEYDSPIKKLLHLFGMFARYDFRCDGALLLLFGAAWLTAAADSLKSGNFRGSQPEISSISMLDLVCSLLAALVVYLVLPYSIGPHSEIDQRALPYLAALLLLVILGARSGPALKTASCLAAAANVLNAGYLYYFVALDSGYVRDYDLARRQVPPDSRLLSIATRPERGRLNTTISLAAPYMIEQGGVVPYVASETLTPRGLLYFDYKNYPFAPSAFWYLRDEPVAWPETLARFDYVIVTKPYNPERLPMESLENIFSNPAAEIFRVVQPSPIGAAAGRD